MQDIPSVAVVIFFFPFRSLECTHYVPLSEESFVPSAVACVSHHRHLGMAEESGLKSSLYRGGNRLFAVSGCNSLNAWSLSVCRLQSAVRVGNLEIS